VKRGQVLAALDTELFEARVVQAQATLAVAQASLKEAEATEFEARLRNERTQKLAQGDAISQQELEAAQAAALRADASQARARAQVLLAKAALSADELNLQKARIRSPIDGIVISRNVEPGQTVAAAFQTPVVFKLAEDLTRMQLHVDIDEADVGQTAAGQSATFTVDAYPDRQFPAQLTLVRNAPRSVQGVVTYEGILQVDNSALLLRPGMTATAEIKTATRKDVLLVPNGALRFTPPEVVKPGASTEPAPAADGGRGRVWTLRGDRPVALAVKLGLTDKRMTEVLGGEVQAGVPLLVDTLVPGK
jgi:HlyD family secretion protein